MECAIFISYVSVQQDTAHGGICTGSTQDLQFLFILLHLNVPSTKFGKEVTVLVHSALLTAVQIFS